MVSNCSLAFAPILPAERGPVQSWVPTAVLLGSLVLFVVYLRLVLAGQADDFRSPEPVRRPPRPPRPVPPTTPEAQAPVRSSGSDQRTETSGLLRVLEAGPDFQRQAAARALSIPFAGTSDPAVLLALLDVMDREDCGSGARAEAYCALRVVADQELPWEDEVKVRQGFPEGVDLEWLAVLRAALSSEEGSK